MFRLNWGVALLQYGFTLLLIPYSPRPAFQGTKMARANLATKTTSILAIRCNKSTEIPTPTILLFDKSILKLDDS